MTKAEETPMGESAGPDQEHHQPQGEQQGEEQKASSLRFDRHLVLEQLGGVRGMVDASLPTIAFIVGNIRGLAVGIWSAVGAAALIFVLRLVWGESGPQAIRGLFGVVVAVPLAAVSGHARDYFALGIVRNAAIGVVLVAS